MLHIAITGVDNGDLEAVLMAANKREPLNGWVVPKDAEPNDPVILFLWRWGFVARAVVVENPWPDRFKSRPAYRARIGDVRRLDLVPTAYVMREIPSWKWLANPLIAVTPAPQIADELERVIEEYGERRHHR